MNHKFPNKSKFYVYMCSFQIIYGVKKRKTCQRTKYNDTTNQDGYLPWLEMIRTVNVPPP